MSALEQGFGPAFFLGLSSGSKTALQLRQASGLKAKHQIPQRSTFGCIATDSSAA
jgi:hypothetical protein